MIISLIQEETQRALVVLIGAATVRTTGSRRETLAGADADGNHMRSHGMDWNEDDGSSADAYWNCPRRQIPEGLCKKMMVHVR
jgi:hypothetical protein